MYDSGKVHYNKIKDTSGRFTHYDLKDLNDVVIRVDSKKLKEAIKMHKIDVVNLTLTSDNRLIDKTKDISIQSLLDDNCTSKGSSREIRDASLALVYLDEYKNILNKFSTELGIQMPYDENNITVENGTIIEASSVGHFKWKHGLIYTAQVALTKDRIYFKLYSSQNTLIDGLTRVGKLTITDMNDAYRKFYGALISYMNHRI